MLTVDQPLKLVVSKIDINTIVNMTGAPFSSSEAIAGKLALYSILKWWEDKVNIETLELFDYLDKNINEATMVYVAGKYRTSKTFRADNHYDIAAFLGDELIGFRFSSVRPQLKEKAFLTGDYYGFPRCCTATADTVKPISTKGMGFPFTGSNYIPCSVCIKEKPYKILSQIKKNRKSTIPFVKWDFKLRQKQDQVAIISYYLENCSTVTISTKK